MKPVEQAKLIKAALRIFESSNQPKEIVVGLPGKDGRNGIDGKDGRNGKDGRDGLPGIKGEAGTNGKDGRDGKDGSPGKDGRDGIDGQPGKNGTPGKDGSPGQDGKDGSPGQDGVNGKDGSPGTNGKDGQPGLDGVNGKDGRNGVDGLPGKDGKNGTPGKDGSPGTNGKDGHDGKDGTPGQDGVNGKDGSPGTNGKDGRDGKDADITQTLLSIREEYENRLRSAISKINQSISSMAWVGSGGGSVNILDNDDVAYKQLNEVANNSVLIFNATLKKFEPLNLATVINNIKTELELKYTKLIDRVDTITYVGEAEPGSNTSSLVWRIQRVDETNDPDLEIKWAEGSAAFDKKWDDRSTYNYS